MSGSNRDEGNSPLDWLLPLIGIVIAITIAWGVGFLHGGQYEKRYAVPHQHAESAKRTALDDCAGRQGAGMLECVQKKIEDAEETARSEQDLTAQQQAAWGSMFGAAGGVIGLFVTIVGTALIYQQFRLTREAVEGTAEANKAMFAANSIARQGQRPWIDFEAFADFSYITHDRLSFNLRVNLFNIGSGVAKLVHFESRVRNYQESGENIYNINAPDDEFFFSCQGNSETGYILPGGNKSGGWKPYNISFDDLTYSHVSGFHAIALCLDVVIFYEWDGDIFHTGKVLNLFAHIDNKAISILPPKGAKLDVSVAVSDNGLNHIT